MLYLMRDTMRSTRQLVKLDEKGNIVIDAQKLMTASSMTTKKPGSNKVARSVNWIR